MKKVYLAGPFFDPQQIDRIERVEEALTNNPTISEFFSPRLAKVPNEEVGTPSWAQKVYQKDISELKASELVVAILDFKSGYVDSGTAFEIGYATSIGKKVVVLNETNQIVNLMITNSIIAYLQTPEQLLQYDFDQLKTIPYTGPLT